jgi:hypothetical protein
MAIVSNLKLVSAIIAVSSLAIGFHPYFRDIFKIQKKQAGGKDRPDNKEDNLD